MKECLNCDKELTGRQEKYCSRECFHGHYHYTKNNIKRPLYQVNKKLVDEEWDYEKNNKLELYPKRISSKSGKKAWWICSKNKKHIWESVIHHRASGGGCPFCYGRRVSEDNCLFAIYPEMAKEWHPVKNGGLTSMDVGPGSDRKIWWRCLKDNSHEWYTSVNGRTGGFSNGNKKFCGCPLCSIKKRSGKNHYLYNPNLTVEDRLDNRQLSDHKNWSKQIYKQDNYTCRKCSRRGGKLNAHHLEGYNSNKSLRLVLSNGTTLCVSCHKNFHRRYGNGNNTTSQFEEYLKLIS
jgi:hypothetical protein